MCMLIHSTNKYNNKLTFKLHLVHPNKQETLVRPQPKTTSKVM